MKTVIEMAREAGIITNSPYLMPHDHVMQGIERFAELVRADEAEKYKWDVHSCGPTCTKVACVAVREAVEAEREACAKVCDGLPVPERMSLENEALYECATLDCAAAIRARGETK